MSQVQAQRSGTCGGNLTWELNDDYTVLTVRGTGEMDNYGSYYNTAPWHAYCEEIKEVIFSKKKKELTFFLLIYNSNWQNQK